MMLMPSALSCDSSHHLQNAPPITRLQTSLFASPPCSPPSNNSSAQNAIGSIFSSCRALQSILTAPATVNNESDSDRHSSLPTPPLSHAVLPAPAPSPMKLRLRSSGSNKASRRSSNGELLPRKKVVKRAPPRGANKRRRAADDDMGRDDGSDDGEEDDEEARPSTPKRARIAPEVIPLGLERADFHNLQQVQGSSSSIVNSTPEAENTAAEGTEAEIEADGEVWSKEDDQVLVELVLEKLKLSKSEWEEIGKSFGNIGSRKDRSSCGRRWKTLMANGDIGLKPRAARRGKIHGTWR